MGRNRLFVAVLGIALATTLAAGQGRTQSMPSEAEQLRRLDIMLMVTGLRCRTGADDFRADYGRFTTRHITELNQASDSLKADMARRYGAAGAARALDRLSVTMANAYGQGHPWLSCADLKVVTRGLAEMRGTSALEEAADQLLAPAGSSAQLAYARR